MSVAYSRLLLLLTVSISPLLYAHSGGLDAHGGHTNRKTGEYHCHRDPCLSGRNQVETATQQATQENRSFSPLYRREDWKHWSDVDGDCQNTRHEILISQAVGKVVLGRNGCQVFSGIWQDPYSGSTWNKPGDLDIDHLVPLHYAHQHGAANWSAARKEQFANDPANLLAVEDNLNQEKSDNCVLMV